MSSVNNVIMACGSDCGIHSYEYSTQPQNIDIHGTIENKHYIK